MTQIISTPSPLSPVITSSGATVLASGTVHTFTPADISFLLEDLRFSFSFISDDKGQRMESEIKSEKEVLYRVYNFQNPLGTGFKSPIKVGKLRGMELYICMTVYANGEKGLKVLHYTFYGKEAGNV